MATSVKLRPVDKARLDVLQAKVTARTGRKVSQQDLLSRLIALGESEPARLATPASASARNDLARLLKLPVRTRIRTREEDIDQALYGPRR